MYWALTKPTHLNAANEQGAQKSVQAGLVEADDTRDASKHASNWSVGDLKTRSIRLLAWDSTLAVWNAALPTQFRLQ